MSGRSWIGGLTLGALLAWAPGPQQAAAAAPEELNFGIISTESSQALRKGFEPFLQDMTKALGMKVNAFFASDYAGVIEAMRFNKVHLAWFGNKSAMEAVDRAGGEVFAQTGRSDWKPSHIEYKEFLEPEEFKKKIQTAEVIVAHAGMGTIISALEMGKPILVMPRKKALGEHRNDHQFATAKRFLAIGYVSVAFDADELIVELNNLEKVVESQRNKGSTGASQLLIETIRNFIDAI